MTEEQQEALRRAEVMIAFSEGKKIEYRDIEDSIWGKSPEPIWNWYSYDYRIAPEPPKAEVVWVNRYRKEMFHHPSKDVAMKAFEGNQTPDAESAIPFIRLTDEVRAALTKEGIELP